ncbi:hypothetical protein [Algoriphagus terrigena]|uniref:hypothetical protein n=1 Tax=Algoriphagus terrigena TaxID=344884 RepID=UPI00047ADC88|nr:hypothetical protein [Algoriphagus terrigena]
MPFQKMICGPILRRVEKNKVSVWAAFMANNHITLKIWEGDNIEHSSGTLFSASNTPIAEGESHTLQFGANLWIALVTVDVPSPGLDPTKVYSYNMVYHEIDDPQETDFLKDKFLEDGKTEGERPQLALGYKKNVLPSFCLPGDTPDKLNIAHGSCRKMHGHGQDALALLDKKIKENVGDPLKRPQALFLTGDQIYADEVPGFFLRSLGAMDGSSIFGPNIEKMTINADGGAAQEHEADVVNYPPYFRQRLVNKFAGFSSEAAANHLLSFEEYAGTYLKYWNIRSWSGDMIAEIKKIADASPEQLSAKLDEVITKFVDDPSPAADTNLVNLIRDNSNIRPTDAFVFSEDSITKAEFRNSDSEKFKNWLKETKSSLRHELVDMAAFMKKLPEVSRVLANVPTYMIMDDHEVTDDWAITKRWNNQVLSKPFGRDIIRNAMMAYAVFQDWGNNPDEYKEAISMIFDDMTDSTKKKAQFLLYAGEYAFRYTNSSHLNTLRTEVIDKMETLLGMGSQPASLKWDYNVKLGTTHAIVLDTRTQRHYESLNTVPELVSESALLTQTPETLTDNPPFVIVVSPCPVLGLPNFEELVQPAATAIISLKSKSDGNPGIIGGNLNFDFEAWGFSVPGFERLIARLDTYKKVVLLSGDVHYGATTVMDYWKGTSATPTSRIVQLTSSALKNEWLPNLLILKSAVVQRILTSFGDGLSKFGWKNKLISTNGAVTPRNRQRLRHTTSTIPIEGWTPGSTVNPAPDWRWKLRVLKDKKGLEDDPVGTTDLVIGNATSMKDGYFNIVSRHQKAYMEGKSPRIAWNSNVGWITFTADGDSWKVKHELLGVKMEYEVSLKTPAAEQARPELPT